MDIRARRGVDIAYSRVIIVIEEGKEYLVPSQTTKRTHYRVRYSNPMRKPNPHANWNSGCTCECPDFKKHQEWCKHLWAVYSYDEFDARPTQPPENPKPIKPTYTQDWSPYHAAQINEKDEFQVYLSALCREAVSPDTDNKTGRKPAHLPDILFAMTFKVYTTFSARRFISDFREAQRRGFIQSYVPEDEDQPEEDAFNYNTILHYFKRPELSPILEELIWTSARPLRQLETRFAVDATGISTSKFDRWCLLTKKDKEKKDLRQWLKLHVICGINTKVVARVKVTTGRKHDSPPFQGLLEGAAEDFEIDEVYADSAYLSVKNLQKVVDVGGEPYFRFKSNSTGKRGGLWRELLLRYMLQQDNFLRHYGLRNNVETAFSMIKRKFDDRVRSRSFEAAQNEVLCKVLCHNICCLIQSVHEFGVKVDFGSGQLVEGQSPK